MGDDSYIPNTDRSCSEVSEEQLRDRECLTQSEEILSGGGDCVFLGMIVRAVEMEGMQKRDLKVKLV